VKAYYKTTSPDGVDFLTGRVNYAAALFSGGTFPSEYQSLFESPPRALSEGRWPCRLFEVESALINPGLTNPPVLRVVREIDAHRVFGPRGKQVTELIERASRIDSEEQAALLVAQESAEGLVRFSAWEAAWPFGEDLAIPTNEAVWEVTPRIVRDSVSDAVLALIVKDLITEEHFNTLYGPWASVMEH